MLLTTNLSGPLAHHHPPTSHTPLHPSATWHSFNLFKQTHHSFNHVLARPQTRESNGELGGARRQQPKTPAASMNAFERAAAYKESLGKTNPPATDQAHTPASPLYGKPSPSSTDSSQGSEIITRDGIIGRKVTMSGEAFSKIRGPKRTGVSSSDFMGLNFYGKRGKGDLPAGLAAGLEIPPPDSLPEVEIITRDGKAQQDSKDGRYKPKFVTWRNSEQPADISPLEKGDVNCR